MALESLEGSLGVDIRNDSITWLAVDVGDCLGTQPVQSTRVPTHSLSVWLGLLRAQWVGSKREHSNSKYSKVCYDLTLEITECYFCRIPLVKRVIKSRPGSMVG